MSIRVPLKTVQQITDTTTSGVTGYTVILPQDTDSVVLKFYTGTFTGTNPTMDVYVQTTDDGGTTWYDCGNLGQITAAVSAQNARWAEFRFIGSAPRTQGASVLAIGACAASTATSSQYTGLPLLSNVMRIYFKLGGTQVVNAGAIVNVLVAQQSATA